MLGSLYLILADADEAEPEPRGRDSTSHPLREAHRGRMVSTTPPGSPDVGSPNQQDAPQSSGGRNKFTHFMFRMGDVLGSPPKAYLRKANRENEAPTYPFVPGERDRHAELTLTAARFTGMVASSRAGSFRGSSPSPPRESRSKSPSTRSATLPSRTGPLPAALGKGAEFNHGTIGLSNTAETSSITRARSHSGSPQRPFTSGSQGSSPIGPNSRAATLPNHS